MIAVPKVTVILPVYNESQLVGAVAEAVLAFAREAPNYHFLFVDDGSTDDTAGVLRKWIAEAGATNVAVHSYPQNRGKGYAVKTGVAQSDGDMVLFTDGDLAYSLDHLPLLVDALRINDVAIGSRSLVESKQRNIRPLRKFMGWVFNRFARCIMRLPYRDTQAGLKGFRRGAARSIFARQRMLDFSFDVELVYLARHYGYKIAEVPARVSETHSYKVSTVSLARDPARMFLDLLVIRWHSLLGKYH